MIKLLLNSNPWQAPRLLHKYVSLKLQVTQYVQNHHVMFNPLIASKFQKSLYKQVQYIQIFNYCLEIDRGGGVLLFLRPTQVHLLVFVENVGLFCSFHLYKLSPTTEYSPDVTAILKIIINGIFNFWISIRTILAIISFHLSILNIVHCR